MPAEFKFRFGDYHSRVIVQEEFPRDLSEVIPAGASALLVSDANTEGFAQKLLAGRAGSIPRLVLESGEKNKTWDSVEKILRAARTAGLGRDGYFIGVGGGVVGDLCAFAASIYMRGAQLCLICTTLLAMADAGLGGKTGIDLFGIKNLAGSFYPAGLVIMPLAALATLPQRELKSGIAELIKTAVLDSDESFGRVKELMRLEKDGGNRTLYHEYLYECISRAVAYKGRIVEEDPRETGKERPLLNLGHTFGHALETASGLGEISHGEAVAWGMARAAELGLALGITPQNRAREIIGALSDYGFTVKAPHPMAGSADTLLDAMKSDKKQFDGKLRFIVPAARGAQIITTEGNEGDELVRQIVEGKFTV